MTKYHINDYELLYLISEMNDYAFEILCMKYAPMIKRRFKDLGISQRYYDDFFQEGLIMLNKAVNLDEILTWIDENKYFFNEIGTVDKLTYLRAAGRVSASAAFFGGMLSIKPIVAYDMEVRFTRFDAIDNQEVANGLFDGVKSWAKERGMEEFVGPLGYSDLEREGLLIEGFEELQTFEEQYNYPYYQRLIENYGFSKDVDWVECKLYAPKERNEKLLRVSNKMLDRYGLRIVQAKTIKEFIDKYSKELFEMIDKTYSRLWY